jgi:hypothetical protein
MSPPRLGPPRNTFNYFEDTLETARLHIAPARCSSRKRQSRAGTIKLSSSQPKDSPYRRTLSRVCSNAWLGAPTPKRRPLPLHVAYSDCADKHQPLARKAATMHFIAPPPLVRHDAFSPLLALTLLSFACAQPHLSPLWRLRCSLQRTICIHSFAHLVRQFVLQRP